MDTFAKRVIVCLLLLFTLSAGHFLVWQSTGLSILGIQPYYSSFVAIVSIICLLLFMIGISWPRRRC